MSDAPRLFKTPEMAELFLRGGLIPEIELRGFIQHVATSFSHIRSHFPTRIPGTVLKSSFAEAFGRTLATGQPQPVIDLLPLTTLGDKEGAANRAVIADRLSHLPLQLFAQLQRDPSRRRVLDGFTTEHFARMLAYMVVAPTHMEDLLAAPAPHAVRDESKRTGAAKTLLLGGDDQLADAISAGYGHLCEGVDQHADRPVDELLASVRSILAAGTFKHPDKAKAVQAVLSTFSPSHLSAALAAHRRDQVSFTR